MRNTNAPSTAGQLRLETHPEFNVVLVYDEYVGGIRAKEFFDTLVLDHGGLFQFICHLWKFEVLREPRLFDVAARDAARADVIVLAIRQSQELPVEVRRWIERWLTSSLHRGNLQRLEPGAHSDAHDRPRSVDQGLVVAAGKLRVPVRGGREMDQ